MRWVVVFLVFANIGYFAWASWEDSKVGYWLPEAKEDHSEAAANRLLLLSEVQKAPEVNVVDVMGARSLLDHEEKEECLVVGPFANAVEVDELRQRLLAIGVRSTERADEGSQQQDYWVHIPPLPSREAALRLLKELQAQRIDSFIITQGELTNGISLGLFSHKKLAENVSRRMSGAGYSVAIKVLPRVPDRWWLEMKSSAVKRLSSTFWDDVAVNFPGLEKMNALCRQKNLKKEP